MAAVIASRVATFVRDALQLQDAPTYFWGDSQDSATQASKY